MLTAREKSQVKKNILNNTRKSEIPNKPIDEVYEYITHRPAHKSKLDKDLLIGKCPLHQQIKPTFLMDTKSNSFICQSCGNKGDCVELVINFYQVRFNEALKILSNI